MGYDLFCLPKAVWSVRLHSLDSLVPCHDYVAISRDAFAALQQRLGLDRG